jgi:hypothetical protein
MDERCLILFKSVHDVIRSEKLISTEGFGYQIIPVPSEISSECGMCIEILKIDSTSISKILISYQISINLYTK